MIRIGGEKETSQGDGLLNGHEAVFSTITSRLASLYLEEMANSTRTINREV